MLRNDTERHNRLIEARASADKAVELAPDDSEYRAIRAFVLDWLAFNPLVDAEQRNDLLVEAEREASRAFQLDPELGCQRSFEARAADERGRATTLRGRAIEVAPLRQRRDGRTTHVNEGLTEYEWEGHAGTGISEYLVQEGT
jgi:hypothetical protein